MAIASGGAVRVVFGAVPDGYPQTAVVAAHQDLVCSDCSSVVRSGQDLMWAVSVRRPFGGVWSQLHPPTKPQQRVPSFLFVSILFSSSFLSLSFSSFPFPFLAFSSLFFLSCPSLSILFPSCPFLVPLATLSFHSLPQPPYHPQGGLIGTKFQCLALRKQESVLWDTFPHSNTSLRDSGAQ